MPSFDEMFIEAARNPVIYQEQNLIRTDYWPFSDGEKLLITFEKTNSEWIQGLCLYMFGFFEIDNQRYKNRIVLWETTSPEETVITLFRDKSGGYHSKSLPPKGILGIKNIWDTGDGVIESWYWGAAMIVEEIENGRRYRCNDGHPDENFDDIVFTITKING